MTNLKISSGIPASNGEIFSTLLFERHKKFTSGYDYTAANALLEERYSMLKRILFLPNYISANPNPTQ